MTGGFQVGPFQTDFQQSGAATPVVTTVVVEGTLGGSKKRVRGPYSDPAIYEAYIARCVAERERPRINVEAAILKEALVSEVEERNQTGYAERDALLRESQVLTRLLALEKAKRDILAMMARQKQIQKQIEELEEQEASMLLALFDEMED